MQTANENAHLTPNPLSLWRRGSEPQVCGGGVKILWLILALALLLRLAYALPLDRAAPYTDPGGDSGWFLANGYALVTGFDDGYLTRLDGEPFPIVLRNLPTPPLYLLFVGFWQAILPPETALLLIRVVQAVLGTLTCYFAFRLARAAAGDSRAGLIAAGALAVSPAFIVESAQIATETLYIALVTGALALYVERRTRPAALVAVGALLGLATLTRAVLLLFPLALLPHLLLADGWRAGLRRAGLVLLVYALVVSTWTVYSRARWERWVIAGEGFAAFLYLGASDAGWQGGSRVDEGLALELPAETEDQQAVYRERAAALISADPAGYVRRRVERLAEAYLQPHGTLVYSGPSLRRLLADWLAAERTLAGLGAVAGSEHFWPKLALYVFHYTALVGGLIGLWLTRRRWRWTLPPALFIAYTTAAHLALEALPRYIFPTEVLWWVFAAAALVAGYDVLRRFLSVVSPGLDKYNKVLP